MPKRGKGRKRSKPVRIQVRRSVSAEREVVPSEGETPELDELLSWQEEPEDVKEFNHVRRRRRWPWVLLGGLGVLFAVTAAGFLVFTRSGDKFSEQDVSLTLEVGERVTSGEEIAVTVTHLNGQAVDLRASELTLSWPEGFTVTSATPAADDPGSTVWRLGTIGAETGGRIVVRGKLVGELGSEKEFAAALRYRPANFNSVFTAKTTTATTIGASVLSLTLDGPTRAVPGKVVTYSLTVENTSHDAIEGLEVRLDDPPGFTVGSADPPLGEHDRWSVASLAAGGTVELSVTGSFAGDVGGSYEIGFLAGVVADGSFTLQNSVNRIVLLVEPELTLEVTLDGHEDGVASFGDTLVFTATLKNNSDFVLEGLTVAVQLAGAPLDLDGIATTPSANLVDAADGRVTWSSAEATALKRFRPGDESTFELALPLLDALVNPSKDDRNLTVSAAWSASSAKVESLGRAVDVSSEPVSLKVATLPKLTAEARYYDEEGAAIGGGPLPPTAGETTSYRVNWILSNSTNDLTEVEVTTVLPESVFWTGRVQRASAGTLSFDPDSRQVRWAINKVPAGTGSQTAQLIASFEVSITPTVRDVGLLVLLSEVTKLSATDAFTGGTVVVERPRLTTELENDLTGRGHGVVVNG